MKYLIITISIALNIVFVIFFLQRSDNVTNVYSTKTDGTPIYKERLEMPSGEVSERVLIDGTLIKESIFFSDGHQYRFKLEVVFLIIFDLESIDLPKYQIPSIYSC